MTILDAINDPKLFRGFLDERGQGLDSWVGWMSALRALYGLNITSRRSRKFIKETTGRDSALLPPEGFDTALFLTGRRSGKSRIAAIIGAYEAVLAGHHLKLAQGEMGLVPIISPTKSRAGLSRITSAPSFRFPCCGTK